MVNAMLTQLAPITWGEDVQPVGKVDTLNEAVSAWLNQHDKDLNQLSATDLQNLIKHLENLQGKSSPKIAGLTNLINQLKSIQATWRQDSGTTLDNLQRDLNCRKDVLTALAGATKDTTGDIKDALDQALSALIPVMTLVDEAVAAVNKSTRLWSATDTLSLDEARALLETLSSLTSKSLNMQALGLDKLLTATCTALHAYKAAIEKAPNDTKAAQLALSKLRQAIAEAKVAYLQKNGATASDPRLQAEQSIIRVEKMWQKNLSIPWLEATKFDGGACTEEAITDEIADLQEQYNIMLQTDNKTGMKYVMSRIQILQRALGDLRSGEKPLTVSLKMFTEIKMLEIATKKVLMDEALDLARDDPDTGRKGDPEMKKLADKYQSEIETLQNMVQTTMDEYGAVLGKWIETNNSAISSAMGR